MIPPGEPVHPAVIPPEQLLRECRIERVRRGGPGGQRRNKVETAVVLTHTPTGTTAQAAERRSPQQNQSVALHRLRLRLAIEHRTPGEPAREASPLWRSRVHAGRLAINPDHDDAPALLAEAMDTLAHAGADARAAAQRLGVTPTQLVKFLKHWPEALERVNRERERRDCRG